MQTFGFDSFPCVMVLVSRTGRLEGFGVARCSAPIELTCMLDVVAVLYFPWSKCGG